MFALEFIGAIPAKALKSSGRLIIGCTGGILLTGCTGAVTGCTGATIGVGATIGCTGATTGVGATIGCTGAVSKALKSDSSKLDAKLE